MATMVMVEGSRVENLKPGLKFAGGLVASC